MQVPGQGISAWSRLKVLVLYLSRNRMGSSVLQGVADACSPSLYSVCAQVIAGNKVLRHVSLKACDIGDLGCAELATAVGVYLSPPPHLQQGMLWYCISNVLHFDIFAGS